MLSCVCKHCSNLHWLTRSTGSDCSFPYRNTRSENQDKNISYVSPVRDWANVFAFVTNHRFLVHKNRLCTQIACTVEKWIWRGNEFGHVMSCGYKTPPTAHGRGSSFVVKGDVITAMNWQGFLLYSFAVFSLVSITASVDRGNFKKCQDSSFCK